MKFINKEGKVFDTIKVADDDYTFTVKLCDNEIDDDNERFSSQCLEQMAEMFVGKYGCRMMQCILQSNFIHRLHPLLYGCAFSCCICILLRRAHHGLQTCYGLL